MGKRVICEYAKICEQCNHLNCTHIKPHLADVMSNSCKADCSRINKYCECKPVEVQLLLFKDMYDGE